MMKNEPTDRQYILMPISISSSVVRINSKPVLTPYSRAYNPRKIRLEPVSRPNNDALASPRNRKMKASKDVTAIYPSASGNDRNQFLYPDTNSVTGNIFAKTNVQYTMMPIVVNAVKPSANFFIAILWHSVISRNVPPQPDPSRDRHAQHIMWLASFQRSFSGWHGDRFDHQ